jgi:hypothetical protein
MHLKLNGSDLTTTSTFESVHWQIFLPEFQTKSVGQPQVAGLDVVLLFVP